MKALKLFATCPTPQKPNGIPDEWPWQVMDCTSEQVTGLLADGFTVMSEEEYASYISSHQTVYNTWIAAYKKVPSVVSPRQIRLALTLAGTNLDNIDLAIASIPDPQQRAAAKIAWEYSVEFQRNNPLLVALGPSLGFSNSQLDDLFILAETL